ncbi:hypothetical protein [Lysobacter gummosus]|uniref:hypothetical protein n=1 Tax=Lysobacter gummosus TaxID=262324 RepID=UPI0036252EFD
MKKGRGDLLLPAQAHRPAFNAQSKSPARRFSPKRTSVGRLPLFQSGHRFKRGRRIPAAAPHR